MKLETSMKKTFACWFAKKVQRRNGKNQTAILMLGG